MLEPYGLLQCFDERVHARGEVSPCVLPKQPLTGTSDGDRRSADMGYIESNLLPGEEVVYKARLHPIVYFSAIFWLLVGLVLIVFAPWVSIGTLLGVFLWLVAALEAFSAWLRIANSEFAVTNRRVLIKTGWISRRSLELILAKIEGIGVEQGGFGRIFNFGTIVVRGTGGTKEPFKNIRAPLEFRREVQERIPLGP